MEGNNFPDNETGRRFRRDEKTDVARGGCIGGAGGYLNLPRRRRGLESFSFGPCPSDWSFSRSSSDSFYSLPFRLSILPHCEIPVIFK